MFFHFSRQLCDCDLFVWVKMCTNVYIWVQIQKALLSRHSPPLPPPQLSLAYPPWSLSAPATVSVGSLPSQSYVDVVGGFSFTCVFLPPPGTTALSLGPGAHLFQVLLIGIALGVVSEELGFQAPDPG